MTRASKPLTFGSVFAVAKAPRWVAAFGLLLATATPAMAQCPPYLATAVNYAAGIQPVSVAMGDFNADGQPDLAVANISSNNVSIMLGNANGTFLPAVNYAVGTWPQSVAVADFNGDGRTDLAVANTNLYGGGSSSVSILLGNANGTFLPAVNYAVGTTPGSVAVGDFNADGRPDLAVANSDSNNVSIMLGNANGTFQVAVNYAVGIYPVSVAVGDFNADGRPDLAVANYYGANLSIMLGNGNGTFQVAVNYAVGSIPISVAVGDFNADGRPDLAVANGNSNNVSILLGNLSGTFQTAVNYAVGNFPNSVAVGDFNADGRPDLAVSNYFDDNVAILLGNGGWGGTFQPAVNYAVGDGPYSVAVGDFNADGRPDLAVARDGSDTNVSVLMNTGQGFPPPTITQQSASVSVCPSGTATFSIVAAGTGPITHQWQWQPEGPGTAWSALSNGLNNNLGTPAFDVSGATTPNLGVSSISGSGGNFRCIVTNACGSVTSNEATLTIVQRCSLADIVGAGTAPNICGDSIVDGSDFIAFINSFSTGEPAVDALADVAGGGADGLSPDGIIDSSDFIAFINAFSAGC